MACLLLKKPRSNFELPLPIRQPIRGRALVCGQGDTGQLGLGADVIERKFPAPVAKIVDAVDVYAGGMHTLVLTASGILYSFGCNDEGALGRDSSEDDSEFDPRKIELPHKVLKISAGDSHSACLLENGQVYAWGSFRDSHGNMGLTLEGNKRTPIEILPGFTFSDVASGADHLVLLTCNGKVFTLGCAEQGQLGRISKRSISGEGRRGKSDLLVPAEVKLLRCKPIENIWATNYCTFLRESQTGIIWAFGLNNYKQLADKKDGELVNNPIKTALTNVKQISGGQHHTLLLKTNGTCHVIGRCDYGRLGLGVVKDDLVELKAISALENEIIDYISCGVSQSFAITADGKLYAWGMGSNLQLGTGKEEDALEPVLVKSKQTEGKRIIRASSGGQHSVFLAIDEGEEQLKPASESVPVKAVTKKAAAAAAAKVKTNQKTLKPIEVDDAANATDLAPKQSNLKRATPPAADNKEQDKKETLEKKDKKEKKETEVVPTNRRLLKRK